MEYREVTHAAMDLMVNLGLMESVMPQMPQQVQQGWEDKKQYIHDFLYQQIEEVQSFGEAFDG